MPLTGLLRIGKLYHKTIAAPRRATPPPISWKSRHGWNHSTLRVVTRTFLLNCRFIEAGCKYLIIEAVITNSWDYKVFGGGRSDLFSITGLPLIGNMMWSPQKVIEVLGRDFYDA